MSTDFEAVIKSLCPEVSADLTEKEKNALPAMAIAAQGILHYARQRTLATTRRHPRSSRRRRRNHRVPL
ncbi:hypothetical protein IAR55_000754 [Kwoniella newhampshirensis]|uniref:Uncharacterized protein n=1 Tax=Kwoniella newhampshirensis TaxID=1651941 RepID=A0AAW0Z3X1_9TREE